MHITILGKRWELKITSKLSRDCRGECEPPHSQRKEIRIRSTLQHREFLEVVTHELLHASDWSKDEEWVTRVAEDISRILWKLGYRRKGHDEDA